MTPALQEGIFFYRSVLSIFLSLPALCCPAVCAAECNCGCCVQQFASVSSSSGSGVQLEEHWLCSRSDEQHNTETWTKYMSMIWALITEEDVFYFKFVFLCFKQNSEQYRNWNVTCIGGSKSQNTFHVAPLIIIVRHSHTNTFGHLTVFPSTDIARHCRRLRAFL